VGQRLRLRRMHLNMTQDQLGRQLSLTFQQIQKYETGENRLSAGRLFRIAALLSVTVEFFFADAPVALPRQSNSDETESRALFQLLASAEGMALNKAYRGIEDPQVKKCLLELLRTLSGEA
jgi:transcriptional regulator with XRE-family HTH domain